MKKKKQPKPKQQTAIERKEEMKSMLAIITEVAGGAGLKPSHPIVIPPGSTVPPGIWGGAGEPFPTNPIVIPPDGPPIIIWGGPPSYVDIGGPAPQPKPEHPIVIPPGIPTEPVPPGFWGGTAEPFPTPPIVIPPGSDLPKKFTVIVKTDEGWVKMDFVPGGKPPTTSGPK
jgi:hypothetical protein